MKKLSTRWKDSGKEKYGRTARSRYLVQAIALEENKSIYHLSYVLILISILVFGILIWCFFAKVPEIASADGEVVPDGRIHKVQHLDGGTILEIHVRNSNHVAPGDKLVTLDDTFVRAELNSLHSSRVDIELRIQRLQSLLDGSQPNFESYFLEHPRLAKTQASLYQEQLLSDKESRLSIENKIKNKNLELASKTKQRKALLEEVSIYQQQNNMRKSLFKKGQVAKVDMLDTSARLASARNRLAEIEGEKERISNTINELKQEIIEYSAQRREALNIEKSEAERQLSLTAQKISDVESRIERLVIRSQHNAIVKGLEINSVNEVVGAGTLLMELVPIGEELLVEAKVAPEDIGHISIDLPAEVKVSSYEYQRFGGIKGSVKDISASTYFNSNGEPYYLAEIKLKDNHVGNNPDKNIIVPGMTVKVDIITGEKTVLEYLLKPLKKGFEGAFSER